MLIPWSHPIPRENVPVRVESLDGFDAPKHTQISQIGSIPSDEGPVCSLQRVRPMLDGFKEGLSLVFDSIFFLNLALSGPHSRRADHLRKRNEQEQKQHVKRANTVAHDRGVCKRPDAIVDNAFFLWRFKGSNVIEYPESVLCFVVWNFAFKYAA